MLLNKKIYLFVILIFTVLFFSCSDKENRTKEITPQELAKYNNPEFVLSQAKKILKGRVTYAYKGRFDKDTVIEIAFGEEVADTNNWGIKIALLKMENGDLKIAFESGLLDGSFRECLFQKIKFPSFSHELVYYNSQDYFMGSSGGEVFSYIVDFDARKIYSAHMFTGPGKSVSLYVSDNIDVPEIKSFFIKNFQRDYPTVAVVKNDKKLEY